MPVTKDTLKRLMILDELLSDPHHQYTMAELSKICSERLVERGYSNISKRTTEKDLKSIEFEPFYMELKKEVVEGKPRYSYRDPRASIFRKELKPEEQHLLAEFLNTLGQFEGLAHFEWFESFRHGFSLEERPKIISFSNNPYLHNSNLLGTLFDCISNSVVVQLDYHVFTDARSRTITFHPYMLKQYNDRWYLIGAADDDDKILNFALDRFDKVTPLPAKKYRECKVNLNERYEDIIGITYYEGAPVEHIVFWADNLARNYIDTKPIHGSQTSIRGEAERELRTQYPLLQEGAFYSIDCMKNYELIRALCSFGSQLLVLAPSHLQDDIYERISNMMEFYKKVRT